MKMKCIFTKTHDGLDLDLLVFMSCEVQQQIQHFVLDDDLSATWGDTRKTSYNTFERRLQRHGRSSVRVFYLVGPLELLLVKVKVSTESAHGEERAQQRGLVRHQRGAGWVLLVLSLQPGQSSWETHVKRRQLRHEPLCVCIKIARQNKSSLTIETVETGPDKLVVVRDFVDDGAQAADAVLDNLENDGQSQGEDFCKNLKR